MGKLFRDFKKACDSVHCTLYTVPTEFGITPPLVKIIKTYIIETCSKVNIGKHQSEAFQIQNGLKQGVLCRHGFSTLLQNMASGRCKKIRKDWNSMEHISS